MLVYQADIKLINRIIKWEGSMTARTTSQPHTLCAQGRKNARGPEWRLFLYISTFSLIKGLKDGPLRLVMYSMANGPQALRGAGERAALVPLWRTNYIKHCFYYGRTALLGCRAKLVLTAVPIRAISGHRDGRTVQIPEHTEKIYIHIQRSCILYLLIYKIILFLYLFN